MPYSDRLSTNMMIPHIIFAEMIKMNSNDKTLSVPDAGRIYFGISRNSAYEAARRGEIPTIRIGNILRVPIVALERMLDEAGSRDSSDDQQAA